MEFLKKLILFIIIDIVWLFLTIFATIFGIVFFVIVPFVGTILIAHILDKIGEKNIWYFPLSQIIVFVGILVYLARNSGDILSSLALLFVAPIIGFLSYF